MAKYQDTFHDLRNGYAKWKGKFANLATFANDIILDLPEKFQRAHEIKYPKNIQPKIFNFIKCCKMMLEGLRTDLVTICRAQM